MLRRSDLDEKIPLRVFGDRAIIKVYEPAEESEGGIYIPDTARERRYEGRVLAVGEGKLLDSGARELSVPVKVGMKIAMAKYGGTELKTSKGDFLVVRAEDIYCEILDEED